MELIDTHVHLNLGHYEVDQEEVIQRAISTGLIKMVSSGVTLESCQSAVALAQRYPGLLYCGLSVHPQDALIWSEEVRNTYLDMSQHPSVVAIGEIGLDYYRDHAPQEIQQRVFREQIQLAQEVQLPLIIHVRDEGPAAYHDVLQILKEEKAETLGGVMHCFSGNLEFAQSALALNFYLAFGGVITFKNALNLQAVVREIPLKHLLLETDCPWLAPVPYRGKRNEPSYVLKVAEKMAELKNTSLEEVAQVTTKNAFQLFGF